MIVGIIIGLAISALLFVLVLRGVKQNGKRTTEQIKEAPNIFANDFVGALDEAINARKIIDHCPKCGSHNIKIYRKGYDYKVGFWGSIFKVRGSGYAGGFGANNACCRCLDCGKDWETDYDYRLL